ncbi:hypothetical protein CY34DRAFT_806018 [Suillus luteus UH-Slu-Lm8-n1]|uniref:DUF6533 domain-containing protein n=1 Tax=Suillus luteus UH-Slu-Lm8-n1 TaxID=930992 RepID=A0A0C9ZUH7_9AGAM|nr:hypothetical protein CY34DRAFT_806018 [Suillus luteus UH-Slu-Lm8-n1]
MTRSLTPPRSLAHPHSNMTFVANDSTWWPMINLQLYHSYWICLLYQIMMSQSNNDLHFAAAAAAVVVYNWVLTIGQEIELIWRQPWSLMTVLYLVRVYMPVVSLTVAVSNILNYAMSWTGVVMIAMLGVIMIARLHAMYQGSRTMLIFLVIIFLAVNIAYVVLGAIALKSSRAEELILSGIHMCSFYVEEDVQLLTSIAWILITVWEILALCLSVWVAVKHFRDLRRLGPSTGSTMGDCFRMLIQSHVLYFASFAGVSCFELINLSPSLSTSNSIGALTLGGVFGVLLVVQTFVLGPRLILSVREYHAKLVAGSDADASMSSIVFQGNVQISTSGTV